MRVSLDNHLPDTSGRSGDPLRAGTGSSKSSSFSPRAASKANTFKYNGCVSLLATQPKEKVSNLRKASSGTFKVRRFLIFVHLESLFR